MVPDVVTVGLAVAYLLLLLSVTVRYVRGGISRSRFPLLLGTSLTWLSFFLLQVTHEVLVSPGAHLTYVLDALALVFLAAGLFLLARWWRRRGDEQPAST